MLSDCLYSSNKRAKNWRDKQATYRNLRYCYRRFYDKYDNETKAREKKELYYKQKELLLSILEPTCIHKEFIGFETEKLYDYEDEFYEHEHDYIHEEHYYDKELHRNVYFRIMENKNNPRYNYYLFYDLGLNHTFHTPITEYELKKYNNYQIKLIDSLNTKGDDVLNLISNQFVNKVIDIIKSGDYTLTE